jgi:hypothetical protein
MNTNASSTILDKERDVDRVPRSITPKPAKTMKAAVVREFGKPLTIEEVPAPEVGPGQILVKIAATAFATPTSTPQTATGRSSRRHRLSRVMRAWVTSSPSARACGT